MVADVTADPLLTIIGEIVEPGATANTDEYQAYRAVAKVYEHRMVRHSAKQYVDGKAPTNGLEGFWSHSNA